jgi:hypothetical protein
MSKCFKLSFKTYGYLAVFALSIVWLIGHQELWGDLGVVAEVEFLHLELEGEG